MARSLVEFIRRHALLHRAARRLVDAAAGAPRWSPLRLLAGVCASIRGEIKAADVVRILEVVEAGGVRCWLAGGWGVDALAGRQTRHHDDLDLVIDDFDRQLSVACSALGTLGFRVVGTYRLPVWMPDGCLLEDDARHRVDLVSIDWDRLDHTLGIEPSPSQLALDRPRRDDVFAEGTVGEHKVPCLSSKVQLVFHSGFEQRDIHRHDVALLLHDRRR